VYPGGCRAEERLVRAEDEEERAANEATFREANERIRKAQRELQPPAERVPFLCECDETSCHEPILLSAEEYELVRDDGTHFVVVSGHPTDGEVVSERDGHAIVRKTGLGGAVAAETDPRKEEA
jgi:hypothetical protein